MIHHRPWKSQSRLHFSLFASTFCSGHPFLVHLHSPPLHQQLLQAFKSNREMRKNKSRQSIVDTSSL